MQDTDHSVLTCYHCGDICRKDDTHIFDEKPFCCNGCLGVFQILSSKNLSAYYELIQKNGIAVQNKPDLRDWDGVKNQSVAKEVLSFSDGKLAKVSFLIPQIHCAACVWLLENLYSINENILQSQVYFDSKEIYITFQEDKLSLYDLIVLLASLGYPPKKRQQASELPNQTYKKRLYTRIGIAGFCAANIMLLQLPVYFDVQFIPPPLLQFFAVLRIALSLLLLIGSFSEYIETTWQGLKKKKLSIDLPIVIGVSALFFQSIYELLLHHGSGYLDSMSGLIFFLLLGRLFQEQTYQQFAFSRDYESFFPLSALVKKENSYENLLLSHIKPLDTLYLRSNEVLACDSVLTSKEARFDYSFVTGEAKVENYKKGDYLYAGGRLIDSHALVTVQKSFSAGYLINLWHNYKEVLKDKQSLWESYGSYIFTPFVLLAAVLVCLYWLWNDPSKALFSFVSVLIIACPCAFALSVPFTTGTMMRILAKYNFFIKHTSVIERLAKVRHLVWDKTGTLSYLQATYVENIRELTKEEKQLIQAIVTYSNHPVSVAIRSIWNMPSLVPDHMEEVTGKGIIAKWQQIEIYLGEPSWVLQYAKQAMPKKIGELRSCLVINQEYVGGFILEETWREHMKEELASLKKNYNLSMLSGDKKREVIYKALCPFIKAKQILFSQSPEDKRKYVQNLEQIEPSLMIGDGLNDIFSLQESYVSLAIAENTTQFLPSSDIIMYQSDLRTIKYALQMAKKGLIITKISFTMSLLYNIVGVTLAIKGSITPLLATILMPISSISVILFTVGSSYFISFLYRKK